MAEAKGGGVADPEYAEVAGPEGAGPEVLESGMQLGCQRRGIPYLHLQNDVQNRQKNAL